MVPPGFLALHAFLWRSCSYSCVGILLGAWVGGVGGVVSTGVTFPIRVSRGPGVVSGTPRVCWLERQPTPSSPWRWDPEDGGWSQGTVLLGQRARGWRLSRFVVWFICYNRLYFLE